MTRKQLEDLGLTKEQADSVMKINGDDIENAKGTASTEIKNLQTEVEGLKTQVGDRDKQLETLKASAGDNADLKKKIEDLQTENATAKATYESELNGNTALPVGDYCWNQNGTGWRVARLGASWGHGLDAGAFYWNLDHASSTRGRGIGGRLVYRKKVAA